MNAAAFGSLPGSACTLGTAGSNGNDRITRNVYDATGKVLKVQKAYGTSRQQDEVTYAYDNGTSSCSTNPNDCGTGFLTSITDAKGNTTGYTYDNYGRPRRTNYPDGTYTNWIYDSGSSRVEQRQRDGTSNYFTYDDLDRLTNTQYQYAGSAMNSAVSYDMLSRVTDEVGIHYGYDVFGRKASEVANASWTASMQYDAAGRRTRLTWNDGFYVTYDYNVLGELTAIKENGSTTLASFTYDDLGRRTTLTRGNGASASYSYDTSSRVSQLVEDLAGTSSDQILDFSYNLSNQITQLAKSNDSYAWTNHYNVNRNYAANNLNQYTATGSITPTYDQRGNLTSAGSATYIYDGLNRLRNAGTGIDFEYYGSGKLSRSVSAQERYAYDGPNLIAEYSDSGTLLRRYVHEFGDDKPLVWYEGSGTTDKRWLSTDERGSVTAITDGSGAVININSYDPWGIPQSTNIGRFQYTGQTWMPELGMYYYKARIYSPTLGRFLQTDPIGYGDGPNWYAYVGNDPVNGRDPTGLMDWYEGAHSMSPTYLADLSLGAMFLNGGTSSVSSGGQSERMMAERNEAARIIAEQRRIVTMAGKFYTENAGQAATNTSTNPSVMNVAAWQIYPTVDAAAVAAIDHYNPISQVDGLERTGTTFPLFGGQAYDTPSTNGRSGDDNVPACVFCSSYYHTHGWFDPRFDNEHFSDPDKATSDNNGVPMYLGTPMGKIEVYDPLTKTIRLIRGGGI